MGEFFRPPFDWLIGWSGIPHRLQEDLHDLTTAPTERLARCPVVVRRLPWWVLTLHTAILAFLTYWIVSLKSGGGNVTAAIVAAIVLLLYVAFAWTLPTELRLERDGILIRRRRLEVVCPWELFAVTGHPFREGWTIVVPVNTAAVDLVGMFRNGELQRSGVAVKTDFFAFDNVDQVRMRLGLELGPQWIGEVLRSVALAIGDEASADTSDTPVAEAAAPLAAELHTDDSRRFQSARYDVPVAEIDACGRLQIPCTRMIFPPECCICGTATDGKRVVRAEGRWLFFRSHSHVDVKLPCCRGCSRSESIRRVTAGVLAVVLNVLAWTALCLAVSGLDWWDDPGLFFGCSGMASVFTVIPAFRIAEWLSDRIGATYFPGPHELRFAFAQEGYAERVVQYLESMTSGSTVSDVDARTVES